MSKLQLNIDTSEERITLFADVVLPIPIPRAFTYRVPYELNDEIQEGCRVIVQFGNKKILTGIVFNIHEKPPENYEAKLLLELLELQPSVTIQQRAFFKWMADYYLCSIGEVIKVGLPSGLKLSSESKIQLNPTANLNQVLSDKESLLVDSLVSSGTLSYNDARNILQVKNIYNILRSLLAKNIILIFEQVKDKYSPKKIKKIRLNVQDEDQLKNLFKELEKKPKQLAILLRYLQYVPVFEDKEVNALGISKSELLSPNGREIISTSSLKTLVKNGVFEEFEEIISRFDITGHINEAHAELSLLQKNAKEEILAHFQKKDVVVFHGITGSGKTEVYIELINEALESGSQVLYLLPEIALTTQIVVRLQKVFGDKMAVYHSKFSDNERVEVWHGVISGDFQLVVGVRSSIFLPFDNLGLIVIDEEHETSYKSYEQAPRYHARDSALYLAHIHSAKTVLGSATPSIESYYHAQQRKYGLVELTKRYGEAQLPEMALANISKERKKKTMSNNFTSQLYNAISETLKNEEQVILFQNRRGYSPYISCQECNWIPKCQNCAVSLTFHLYKNELQCHYCGYRQRLPNECSTCGSANIQTKSFGTEQIEEDIKLLLPEAKVQRMDLDTTRNKHSYQTIIDDFSNRKMDILVGTQMVTKGLDFDHVNLVGVIDVDMMMNFPDFRSHERTFQLTSQVSGRAGRREKAGRVIIQTSSPEQMLLRRIINHDYTGFYQDEIAERAQYDYPPFTRLISITLKHDDKSNCYKAAVQLANQLTSQIGSKRILGPDEPAISKIRNKYLMNVLIKIERENVNLKAVKAIISSSAKTLLADRNHKGISIIVDVDPY